MCFFSLVKLIGVDAMRGDQGRASQPWQEIWGSSDARLHQHCVAPVSLRRARTVMCWDTLTLCVWASLCWSHGPCGGAPSIHVSFFPSFCTLVLLDVRPISFTMAAKLRGIFIWVFVLLLILCFLFFPPLTVTYVLAKTWMPCHDVLSSWLGFICEFHSMPVSSQRKGL